MYDLALLIVGLLALAGVTLPLLLRNRLVGYPTLVVAIGVVLGLVWPGDDTFDPIANSVLVERLSEFAVIIALTGLGLAIDRRPSWRGWSTTTRLLAVTMPLTIAAAAGLGWWIVGLAPATAMLFAASLAPTDPVIANDVQIGPPSVGAPDADEGDEVRFALTSESSLNDGLAFPFTYLAVLMASRGTDVSEWLVEWLLRDVGYRIAVGVGLGWVVGRLLGALVLRLVDPNGPVALLARGTNPASGLLALSITLVSYGVTELAQGYGFIAVFVTAAVVRDAERANHIHDHIHDGAEQLELMALGLVLLLFGAALADGIWTAITLPMVAVAVLLVVVVRPAAGLAGLLGDRKTTFAERVTISVFGIRGLGSIYYLAYGLNQTEFVDPQPLWALTSATILVSLALHGLGARPWMRRLDVHRPPQRLDHQPD